MSRTAGRGVSLILMALLMSAPVGAAEINFEGLPEGYVIEELSEGHGITGPLSGVVVVFGFNPVFGANTNTAIVYASDCPPGGTPGDCSGGDDDLGTPNECVGGPGTDKDLGDGTGGECGSPFENVVPLGNTAIVAENLNDPNGDGNVDNPDDADEDGQFIEFDFKDFGRKGITVNEFTYMDNDQGEFDAMVEFFGPGTSNPSTIGLPALGDNGVHTIAPGIEGVDLMRIVLNGSGAVDNVVIEEEIENRACWVTLGGFNKAEISSSAGKKYCTLGGNVGPPPSGALEINWHETGDPALDGAQFHSNDISSVECQDLTDGPGQPGGKKGFVEDTLFFECDGRFNNEDGYSCRGYYQDNGEPQGKKGKLNDKICIEISDANGVVASCGEGCDPVDPANPVGNNTLVGGNVQIHPPVGKP